MTSPIQTEPEKESLLPQVIGQMSIAELRNLLLGVGGSGTIETYAAIDILIDAFGGLLLAVDEIRACITVDDGRAYVDWPALDKFAGYVHDGFKKPYPIGVAGVGVVLHVACALATGKLTPSSARTLAGSLAVAGRRQRPAPKQ